MIRAILPILFAAFAFAQTGAPGKTHGMAVAAITIEVFSDFQCPSCKQLHETTLKPLLAEHVAKGKVLLINRDFPLPQHAYARLAAAYANAAGRVGMYDTVADALFAKQEQWSKDGRVDAVATSVLKPPLAQKVRALAKTPEIAREVESDLERGKAARVQQTPTMVIAHKGKTYPVAGAVSFPILRRFLDDLLKK